MLKLFSLKESMTFSKGFKKLMADPFAGDGEENLS